MPRPTPYPPKRSLLQEGKNIAGARRAHQEELYWEGRHSRVKSIAARLRQKVYA
jgi:hypothetical protein